MKFLRIRVIYNVSMCIVRYLYLNTFKKKKNGFDHFDK